MTRYRDETFCLDAGLCDTEHCRHRITGEDTERAARLGMPIEWESFADRCPIYTPAQRMQNDARN